MKKKRLLPGLTALLLFFSLHGLGQTTITNLTFESAGGYTTSVAEFSDGGYDYFIRTDGTDLGSGVVFTNIQGSYYFAAQDIDAEGATLPVTLTIDDVDITGYSNLVLKVYLAEDDDGTNQDWDDNDYVHFDIDIDNSGTFTEVLWIESDIPSGFNGEPLIDTDFDGVGDGTAVTDAFTQFVANISGTGNLIDIKITFFLNSGDEDIAIDNIELVGTLGGNDLPFITNIIQTPSTDITSTTTVSVSADVTDSDGTITNVELHWGTATGSLPNTINMSFSSGDTYVTDTDIPAQSAGTTVFYEIEATDNEAGVTTSSEQSYTVVEPATTTLPFSEGFDSNLGDMYTYSVSGASKEWTWSSGYAYMNGYNSGDIEEDWMIFPGINLDSYSDEILMFESYYQYGSDDANNYLKLFYSTDYSGLGDPSGASWTELSYTQPGSETTWTSSGVVDLSAISGTSVWIAFKYRYEPGSYRLWRIDDISVLESSVSPEPSNHVTNFSASADSESQITTTWTDALAGAQAPDAYLVKAAIDPATPTAPVDGTPEADGSLVLNVAHGGIETAVFTGLSAGTTYNFAIWPYTNVGTDIDYKTDGTVPTATAITDAPPALVINEILADPDATNGDANGDGTVSTSQDEFVEIVNNSNSAIDLSGYQIFDAVGVRHVFPNGTFIQPNDVIVVFGGGTPTGFDHLDVQTASAGFLGFNNGGDDVIIKDPSDITVTSVTYGSEGGDNQSLVRNPDVTGSFVKHSTLPGGALFSPAKKIDDTFFKTPNVWSGAAKSTDWGTAGNWSDGIPDSDNRVVIPASLSTYPIITAAATCNSLVMEEGASLLGQENLTINGTATVETSYVGYTSNMDGWYLIGTPVGTFDINGSDFDPGDPDDFYGWSETENLWKNHKAGFPLQVVPGIGNLVAYSPGNAGTKRFIGSLNSSSYSPTLSNSTSSWNLVGNPYCSPVDWSEVAITDVSSPKVLDNTDGSYDDVTDDINTAQGVFVYAESGSSTLAFETADQTHGSAKKADPVFATLKAQFDNNDVYIRLGANEQASLDYEWQHDARYLAPISEIPNLAAITGDDIMVSTYVLNPNTETALVPLSFAVSADQEITFGLEGQFGFKVTLEDLSNGIMTELTEGNTYTYSAQTSDDPERFHLHLIKSSFGIGEGEDLEGVHAYSSGQNLYVNVQQDLTGATVAVFNTLGQELVSKSLAGGLETLRMEQPGVYIVTVKASQGTYATKLIIQ